MGFNLIYALNFLSYLAIVVVTFYTFFVWHKKKVVCKVGNIIGVNGMFYLILAFLSFVWAFGLLKPTSEDLILIESFFIALQAILILFIIYKLTNNKHLLYFLGLFLTSVFFVSYGIGSFFLFITFISHLLMLIIFANLLFFLNHYLRKAGLIGLCYSIVSILFLAFAFLGLEGFRTLKFIPNILMFFVFWFLYLDVKKCGMIGKKKTKRRIKSLMIFTLFFKYLIFIFTISMFIMLSTVAIHEMGHAIVSQYYGCTYAKAVVYDTAKSPYTEMRCDSYYNDVILTLGGIGATLVVVFLFLLTGGEFINRMTMLMLGFSLLVAYGDLIELGISINVVAIVIFTSMIIITLSIMRISLYYIKRESQICKPIIKKVKVKKITKI
jgi:hypothetical protein